MFVNSKKLWQKISSAVICFAVSLFSGCSLFPKEKITIPVAMATDANYVLPTVVAMTSLFENAGKSTTYKVKVLVPGNMNEESKAKMKSLEKKYGRHTVDFHDMKDAFSDSFVSRDITVASYYRLKLPTIFGEEKRCLWLDGDIIVLHDLTSLYNIGVDDYYWAGVPDEPRVNEIMRTTAFEDHSKYVCAGITVLNLERMRKDGLEERFIETVNEKQSLLNYHDQDVLNYVCFDGILDLPLKYGIFSRWLSEPDYEKNEIVKKLFSKKEWNEAVSDPYIIHFAAVKPWKNLNTARYYLWWDYAQKTDFYKEITETYKEAFSGLRASP